MAKKKKKLSTVEAPETLHGISMAALRQGINCPTCCRFMKVNNKRLNHTMMQYLFILYASHSDGDGWVEASWMRIHTKHDMTRTEDKAQTGDYKILHLWGLAENHPNKSGFARITPLGIDFVEMRAFVREGVLIENYRSNFICFTGGWVTALDANGTSFNLAEL